MVTNVRFPVCEPSLTELEREKLIHAFDSGQISGSGEYVEKLESSFSQYLNRKYAVAVNNGTSAVHLMLLASELRSGDEVIVPTFTMAGSIFPLLYAGLRPVFVDIDPTTWCMDPNQVDGALSNRTRAILPVHIYGQPCSMDEIKDIAQSNDLLVIEDAAEALGSQQNNVHCGKFGDSAAFSLFANKVVSSGEGGVFVTDDEDTYKRAKSLRNLSFPLFGPREYIHDVVGYNYRLSNLLAAVGYAQMLRIDSLVSARIRNAHIYMRHLEPDSRIVFQPNREGNLNSRWMIAVRVIDTPADKLPDIRRRLANHGIETRPFFRPMHLQKSVVTSDFRCIGTLENSKSLSNSGFYLPSSSHLSESDISEISERLLVILDQV